MSYMSVEELKMLWENDSTVKIRTVLSKEDLEDLENNQLVIFEISLEKNFVSLIENYCSLLGITKEVFLEYSVMSMVKNVLKEISSLSMYEIAKMPIEWL